MTELVTTSTPWTSRSPRSNGTSAITTIWRGPATTALRSTTWLTPGGLDSLDERLLRRREDRATSDELTSSRQQSGRDHDEEDTDAGAGQGVEDGCAGCLVQGQAKQREHGAGD